MFEITYASGAKVRVAKRSGIVTQQAQDIIKRRRNDVLCKQGKGSIRIKEKIKLIWTFIFFEIIVKIVEMCTSFLFKKSKDARLFSSS